MPSEPVSMAATSESMSPNRLSVTMTSNCFGCTNELHAAGVGQHVLELDVGVFFLVRRGHHLVPEHAGLHDVALFHRADAVVAGARQFEGDAGDALDLVGVVDLGVDAALLAVAEIDDFLRLAEIDAAGQLADDQDIEAVDQLRLQRGSRCQRRIADRRAQVGETAAGPCAGAAGRLPGALHKVRCPTSGRRRRRRERRRPPVAFAMSASEIAAPCAS